MTAHSGSRMVGGMSAHPVAATSRKAHGAAYQWRDALTDTDMGRVIPVVLQADLAFVELLTVC